jgi:hypothetical protein
VQLAVIRAAHFKFKIADDDGCRLLKSWSPPVIWPRHPAAETVPVRPPWPCTVGQIVHDRYEQFPGHRLSALPTDTYSGKTVPSLRPDIAPDADNAALSCFHILPYGRRDDFTTSVGIRSLRSVRPILPDRAGTAFSGGGAASFPF